MDILIEAPGLLRRYQKGDAFRRYVDDRAILILPVGVMFLVFSLATTAGSVVYIGGTHSFLVLLMLIVSPFLLGGTFCVLLFVFFSWLETRAIAVSLAKMRKHAPRRPAFSWPALKAGLQALPPLPWLLVGLLVVVPLLFLAQLSLAAAALMLLLLVATPVAYVFLDR